MEILENIKLVNGLAPSSDLYNTDPATDVINTAKYEEVVFLIFQKTAGTNTGDATITVEECTSAAGAGNTAIAFKYFKNDDADTDDDLDAEASASASGFTTTANKTAMYAIRIKESDLSDGSPFVRVVLTESTDDPVIGSVVALCKAKYPQDPATLPTALS